jgi:CBS domain-containing protein
MAQQIRELMTPNPVALPGTASVHEAATAMRDAQIGDVIVIENNKVCGIVTDRDIVVRTVAERQDPATTTLADICSHSLVTVTPTASVEEAVRLMRTHAIRRLPVVEGEQAVGIVSLGDLAVERDPGSALGEISGAPPTPNQGQARRPARVSGAGREGSDRSPPARLPLHVASLTVPPSREAEGLQRRPVRHRPAGDNEDLPRAPENVHIRGHHSRIR